MGDKLFKDVVLEQIEQVASCTLSVSLRTMLRKGLTEDGLCALREFLESATTAVMYQALKTSIETRKPVYRWKADARGEGWTLEKKGLRVHVTRNINYPKNAWVLICHQLQIQQQLKDPDVEDAKREAIWIVTDKIANLYAELM
jgi:hypothetical protein